MIAAVVILLTGIVGFAGEPQPPGDLAEQAIAPDQFLIVPLRAHILTAPDLKLADCKLQDADVRRIVGKLNRIWSKAGIYFGLESIVREPAAQRDRFRLMIQLKGGELGNTDIQLLLPKQSRAFDGLHAFFFHELPFNGTYLGDDCAIVQEGARLNEVKGGIDEPMPRVLGFSLGLALGLQPRREPQTSLMALGTTGVALDADDVERARRVAKTVNGVMTMAEARQAAQGAGNADASKRLQSWLAEIASVARLKDDAKNCDHETGTAPSQ